MAERKTNFESALGKLEEVVSEMERGDLSLDETMKRFEEGKKQLAVCRAELSAVMRRIEKVTADGVEPFDAAEGARHGA